MYELVIEDMFSMYNLFELDTTGFSFQSNRKFNIHSNFKKLTFKSHYSKLLLDSDISLLMTLTNNLESLNLSLIHYSKVSLWLELW